MPELQVVTYPQKAPGIYAERAAFRVKDDVFTTGDDVLIASAEDGGKPIGARILTIDAGEYPKVLVKLETGEARELAKAELERLSLDQLALLERSTHADPRPRLEVIRVAGQEPFVLMGDERVKVGDFVVFDRCSPGVVPMIIDRIESKHGKDVVWIQEPMPLAEGGERINETIRFGGRDVAVSYENWPDGSPEKEKKLPAYMIYTRPLGEFEYHLMKTEKARRAEVQESRERARHMDVREDARFDRYQVLKDRSPAKVRSIFSEHDVEMMMRRKEYKREKTPALGHFNLEGLGWALSRSHSGLHYGPNNAKILMLRGERIDRGGGLVYRRDGRETPMKVLEVLGGETVRVAWVREGRLVQSTLTKQDNLFLFPDEEAVGKLDQLRRRARVERMLASV